MTDFKFEDEKHNIVKEAFKKLTKEEQAVISQMITKNMAVDRLDFLKRFIIAYEPDSALDGMVCLIMSEIGSNLGSRIVEAGMAATKEDNSSYAGSEATKIAVDELRKMADQMESTVMLFEAARQE